MSYTYFRVNPHSIVAWISRHSFLKTAVRWSLSDCNGTPNYNHLVCKRTLNHLAKLAQLRTENQEVVGSSPVAVTKYLIQFFRNLQIYWSQSKNSTIQFVLKKVNKIFFSKINIILIKFDEFFSYNILSFLHFIFWLSSTYNILLWSITMFSNVSVTILYEKK